MNSSKAANVQIHDTTVLNDLIIDAIQDIKGKDIIKLDLRKLDDAPTDYFIICEGESTTQVSSIANNIFKRVKEELGYIPRKEGVDSAQWILVDFFDTVVHVFYPEARALYDLEDLWSDAEFTEFQNL